MKKVTFTELTEDTSWLVDKDKEGLVAKIDKDKLDLELMIIDNETPFFVIIANESFEEVEANIFEKRASIVIQVPLTKTSLKHLKKQTSEQLVDIAYTILIIRLLGYWVKVGKGSVSAQAKNQYHKACLELRASAKEIYDSLLIEVKNVA